MTTKDLTTEDLKNVFGEITFGIALKAERESRDMTRREFSGLLSISIQSLADLENERRIPSPERASKIAKQIGESEKYWIQLSLQDQLRNQNLKFKVTVA
ncbi:MAG: helix-turn-helix domain-containing protein [Bacteriovoracaceae bacterium]